MSTLHEDADHLDEPAGPLRVGIGLILLPGGLFLAALADGHVFKYLGLLLFLAAPFVMLRRARVPPN
jgi:hypothetical protein